LLEAVDIVIHIFGVIICFNGLNGAVIVVHLIGDQLVAKPSLNVRTILGFIENVSELRRLFFKFIVKELLL